MLCRITPKVWTGLYIVFSHSLRSVVYMVVVQGCKQHRVATAVQLHHLWGRWGRGAQHTLSEHVIIRTCACKSPQKQSMHAHCIGMPTRARMLLGGGTSLLEGGAAGSADQGTVDDIFPAEKKEVSAHCSATLSWQAGPATACSIWETWSCLENKAYA